MAAAGLEGASSDPARPGVGGRPVRDLRRVQALRLPARLARNRGMNLPRDLRLFRSSQIEKAGVTLKTGYKYPVPVGSQEAWTVPEVEILGDAEAPHAVDTHVGARVRMRRKELGLSQEVLAEFQGVAEGSWEDSGPAELERSVNAFLMTPEGFDIVRRFPRLRPSLRRRVLELVRTLADVDDD